MGDERYIVGIDPGLKGAIAIIAVGSKSMPHQPIGPHNRVKITQKPPHSPNHYPYLVGVWDMPTLILPKSGKNGIDVRSLFGLIAMYADKTVLCLIEEVGAMPRDGVVSAFRFGMGTGMIHACLQANGIEPQLCRPAVWKPMMGLSSSKDLSRKKAIEFFPGHESYFARKKDDGRAEASLLAHLGMQIILKEK